MTDTDPRPLTDAELLAWAVILGYRDQQQRDGITILLLPYPPCPTCWETVHEATIRWERETFRDDVTIGVQPCGHVHRATQGDVDRVHHHLAAMMGALESADCAPAGEGWNTERIIADARARVGEPEATEPDRCCVCGGGQVVYRNYLEQPFCGLCANCECAQNPCVRTGVDDPAVSEAAEVERLRRMVRQLMTVNRATVTRVEALATRIAAGHPVQDNATSLAAAIRDAARGDGPLEKAGD